MGNFTVMAQSMIPDNAGGATVMAPNSTGMTIGPMTYIHLDFPSGSIANASFAYVMPGNYDGGTITVTPYWYADATSGTVIWSIRGFCEADGGAMNAPWGTAQTSTDTATAAQTVHIGPATAAITLGGTPANGNLCWFQVQRPASGGTMESTAHLLAVRISYGLS